MRILRANTPTEPSQQAPCSKWDMHPSCTTSIIFGSSILGGSHVSNCGGRLILLRGKRAARRVFPVAPYLVQIRMMCKENRIASCISEITHIFALTEKVRWKLFADVTVNDVMRIALTNACIRPLVRRNISCVSHWINEQA
jgi:hypothetical protein